MKTLYLILACEVIFSILILYKVSYTEIDFSTYMQQVEVFLNGERDYLKIRGDSGPLVYPAGHLYLFAIIYYVIDHGKNIFRAQILFLFVLLATVFVMHSLYKKSDKVHLISLMTCLLSKRIHSIFLLRLFNDVLAMLIVYLAILLLLQRKYAQSSIMYRLLILI